MTTRIKDADVRWDVIERDWRADKKSINLISQEHGISRSRINRRAEKEGWQKNLSDRIDDAVRSRLHASLISDAERLPDDASREARDEQIIKVVAQTQVEVVQNHRKSITDLHNLTRKMSDRLNSQLENGVKVLVPGKSGEGATEVTVDLELDTASRVLSNLTNSMHRLIAMERQAYGMDKEEDKGGRNPEMQTVMDMILGGPREGLPSEAVPA